MTATTIQMDPITFQAGKHGVTLVDPAEPFQAAAEAYQAERYADALARFDQIAADNPGTQHGRSSLYNAGLALEQLDRKPEAAQRYRKLADEYPDAPEALDALFRLGATLAQLKDWPGSEAVHKRILGRDKLTLSDQIEAYARLGEAKLEGGHVEDAERTLRQLRELYRAHEQEERLDTDYFLAMGTFYLAECAHTEYQALRVRLPQKQLEDDLEAKARLLLLAQQRYLDTVRVRHAQWATAAGFRIGSLYREFYNDVVEAPVPPALKGEALDVYRDEVKKKVRVLLTKAVSFHEKNVLMAERAGEKNEWVEKSSAELDELRHMLEPGADVAQKPLPLDAPPPAPLPPARDVGRTTL